MGWVFPFLIHGAQLPVPAQSHRPAHWPGGTQNTFCCTLPAANTHPFLVKGFKLQGLWVKFKSHHWQTFSEYLFKNYSSLLQSPADAVAAPPPQRVRNCFPFKHNFRVKMNLGTETKHCNKTSSKRMSLKKQWYRVFYMAERKILNSRSKLQHTRGNAKLGAPYCAQPFWFFKCTQQFIFPATLTRN